MTRRIISMTFLMLCAFTLQAQVPETATIARKPGVQRNAFACQPGASPFAGSATPSLAPTASSDNVLFLCFNDEMIITHDQLFDLSGDPNTATQAGIGYVFYECDPSAGGFTGPTIDDIEMDPCLELDPPPTMGPNVANFWVATDDVQFNGNTTFVNDGTLQTTFAMGNPAQFWFAPVTIDDFADLEYELDPDGDVGGCVNVNVASAFSIIYLNEISATNINPNFGGNGCTATFDISGGFPEWNVLTNPTNTMNYTIDISLVTDPTIKGTFDAAYTHGETVQFLVPQPGTYTVTISDQVSCDHSFDIDMGGCVPVTFNLPNLFANVAPPTQNVCLDITVNNFTDVSSFQFLLQWDNTVLSYTGINPGQLGPPELFFGPPSPTNFINFSWNDLLLQTQSVGDGQTIFSICFDVIGTLGDVSPVTFEPITEVAGANQVPIAFAFSDGLVRIVSGTLLPSFTTCSTTPTDNNGSFTLTMMGGTAPYQISWVEVGNPGNTGTGTIASNGGTFSANNLPPGDYDVTIIDATGDQTVTTVTIINAPPLAVQTSFMNPTCAGDTDGSVSATIVGGIMPLDIEWSVPGNNGSTMLNGLGQGPYTVTVTDDNGCQVVSGQSLITSPIVIDTGLLNHVSCSGAGNDGAITVTATGGTVGPTSDYTFSWDNSATGPSISNLIPGIYCVTVTDDNNCQESTCIEVLDALRPVITGWDSVSVACANDINGELTVFATPGNAPITSYLWSSGAMDATATGLSSGVYTVTITASDGCTTVGTQQLFAPALLSLDSVVFETPSCPGVSNGSIAVFVSGGTQPFEYQWSTGVVNQFQLLPALVGDSLYSVTVIDGNNCDTLIIPDIFLQDAPSIDIVFTDSMRVSCNGGVPCDGSATAIASGGTSGSTIYNFNWSNGESEMGVSTSTATMLCQGENILEVNDGLCSTTDTIYIGAPTPVSFDPANTMGIPPSCNGGSDGGAMVAGSGGTPGYNYVWSTMDTGPTISGVTAGTYTVTITDVNMCAFSIDVQVREPEVLVALIDTLNTNDVTCDGDVDGQVAIAPIGGTAPYTFTWAGGVSNSNTAFGLPPSTYSVTVTDANGCTADTFRIITSPPPVFADIPVPEEPLCAGFQTLITVDSAWGGTPGLYTFSVDNGPQQLIGSGVPVLAGTHFVSVFDQNGCSTDTILNIDEPDPVEVILGADQKIQLGDSAIIVARILDGGVPIDTITWTPLGDLTCISPDCRRVSVKPLTTTEYSLIAINEDGCTGEDQVIIEVDKNRNVFIPNIFTPDGDGINDFFKPFTGTGVEIVNFFQVYDRWGEKVHEFTNFLPDGDLTGGDPSAWDGFFRGKKMNSAVYVYLISVRFVDGVELLYRGDITLIR